MSKPNTDSLSLNNTPTKKKQAPVSTIKLILFKSGDPERDKNTGSQYNQNNGFASPRKNGLLDPKR
jgi:hypothetical protein